VSKPTDSEMDLYPHVFFTDDSPWDPTSLDAEFDPLAPVPAVAAACREANDFGSTSLPTYRPTNQLNNPPQPPLPISPISSCLAVPLPL